MGLGFLDCLLRFIRIIWLVDCLLRFIRIIWLVGFFRLVRPLGWLLFVVVWKTHLASEGIERAALGIYINWPQQLEDQKPKTAHQQGLDNSSVVIAGRHIADDINSPILVLFAYASINLAQFGERTFMHNKGAGIMRNSLVLACRTSTADRVR
jgi:hypothetical protein